MSELNLDAIEVRENAATEGPWEWVDSAVERGSRALGGDARPVLRTVPSAGPLPADAEFIAHARTDVPALVAEVQRLRDERDHWRVMHHTVTRESLATAALHNASRLAAERDELRATIGRVEALVFPLEDGGPTDDEPLSAGDLRAALEGEGA